MILQRSMILAALLLGGCTTPAITGAGGGQVTVRYDPMLYTRDTAATHALSQCRAENAATKSVRFVSSSESGPLDFRYDVFACER